MNIILIYSLYLAEIKPCPCGNWRRRSVARWTTRRRHASIAWVAFQRRVIHSDV